MKLVSIPGALEPKGHYSPAVIQNGLVYISGQLPVDPYTGNKLNGSVEEETLQVLKNIGLLLKEAGSAKELVLKTTVYVSDISLWDKVNTVYSEFFGSHKPARAVVPTKELHFGFKVEIEAIAATAEMEGA